MRVVETVPGNMLPMVAQNIANIANLQNVAMQIQHPQQSQQTAIPQVPDTPIGQTITPSKGTAAVKPTEDRTANQVLKCF